MKLFKTILLGSAAVALMAGAAMAQQRTLVFNSDNSDPAPKKAFEELAADFEAANPDIDVVINTFDREGYKTAIRNFLTADAPDVANWYPGNRALPFVGQMTDISDVWEANGLKDSMSSALGAVTFDGKQMMMPYSNYQWGIYYNKDAYKAAGVELPAEGMNWDQFIANCEKFKTAGIDCLTTGSKGLWPLAGIFDYMSLRTNGYQWHMDLTAGKIAWTDQKVKDVFANFGKVQPYMTANHAAIEWQEAIALLTQGKAANYVMGNFAVALMKDGGMTNDNLGFMAFPEITAGVPRAEDAPTDALFIPAGAKNVEDAKKFLAFVATPEAQSKMNMTLGQLPINKNATVGDDPFIQAGFKVVSTAAGLAQFFDRDAPAEMAKAGMEGFQQFLAQPEKLDEILARLEQVRGQVYK